jgi:hypothetical protein
MKLLPPRLKMAQFSPISRATLDSLCQRNKFRFCPQRTPLALATVLLASASATNSDCRGTQRVGQLRSLGPVARHWPCPRRFTTRLKCHSVGRGTSVPTGNSDACRRTDCASRRKPATVGTWQITSRKDQRKRQNSRESFLVMVFM